MACKTNQENVPATLRSLADKGAGPNGENSARRATTGTALRKAALAGLLALCAAPSQAAGINSWTDENGVRHISDQVPPEAAKLPHARITPEGKVTEFNPGQKTPEQLETARRLKRLRIDQQRILEEQRESDLSLNRTYRSEEEIQATLKGKLDTIDSARKIADANRLRQEEVLRSTIKRAADIENAGQAVPQPLRDSIESTRKQIVSYQEKARTLENSKAGIIAEFDKDFERFKSLEALRQNPEYGSLEWKAQGSPADVPIVSAVACTLQQCEQAWALAKAYLKSKSTLPLINETQTILQTAGPRSETDMAVLVVRITGKTADTLFLDTACHITSIGSELCSGPIAKDIRSGFVPFLEETLKAQ